VKISEGVPRTRVQTLSDLIFGLALSIGALTLLSGKPTTDLSLFESLASFGFAFYILAVVWLNYTRISSASPVETEKLLRLTLVLLFLVSVEPYLYNLITISFSPLPGQLGSSTTTSVWAVDMGAIYLILATFTHQITVESGRSMPADLLQSYRRIRGASLLGSGIFLASALPIFWDYSLFNLEIRFWLWATVLVVRILRRTIG